MVDKPRYPRQQYGPGMNDFYRQQQLMNQQQQNFIQQQMLQEMQNQTYYQREQQQNLPPPQYVPNPIDSFIRGYQQGRDMRQRR